MRPSTGVPLNGLVAPAAARRMRKADERPLPKPWTVDDFLAWERQQPERYEFVGGLVRMMVGGSNAPRRSLFFLFGQFPDHWTPVGALGEIFAAALHIATGERNRTPPPRRPPDQACRPPTPTTARQDTGY